MAKIVFILGSYYPETDANVICSMNVIRELQRRKHKVICVCGTKGKTRIDYIDGVEIRRVHHIGFSDKYAKLRHISTKRIMLILHMLKSIFILPIFPNSEPIFSYNLTKEVQAVLDETKVDCIIGVFRPFASIQATINSKMDTIKTVGYYLDVLKGADPPFGISKSKYIKICDKKEHTVFSKLDFILMAENGKISYIDDRYNDARKKMHFVNFPTMVLDESDESREEGIKTFLYAGYMNNTYRNPEYLLSLFASAFGNDNKAEMHLYGKCDAPYIVEQYTCRYKNIFYHGIVDKMQVDEAIRKVDCVINLGNEDSSVVPSKLFELIASKKPILQIQRCEQDSCLQYLDLYPNALVIDKSQSLEYNLRELKNFCERKSKTVTNDYLLENYYSATPQSVVDIIESFL